MSDPALQQRDSRLANEYRALRTGAMLVERRNRFRATFTGEKSAEVLTGLVTNDVLALAPGQGQYAALLTPKAKIIADMRIWRRDADLLVDAPRRAEMEWWATIRKFVNPRLSKVADVSETIADIGVFGVGSRAVCAAVLGLSDADLADLVPYSHRSATLEEGTVLVTRSPDAGLEGYEILAAPELARTFAQRAIARGATEVSSDAFDVARIEAGRPEWGVDMDETTMPQEAALDELHAISYTKGCYTGQETVARVHFRGHVNRHLRGLRFDAGSGLLPSAELVDDSGSHVVGDVRSVAVSPRLGGIALSMVRREVADGARLTARWPDGTTTVTVEALPFPQ